MARHLKTVVRELREFAQKTQEEFGKEVGVSHAAICFWENGQPVGSYSRILLLQYAKRASAPAELVRELEAVQPGARA